jgi:predicted metal-dependent phosphoesterase TrpH
LIDLHVHTTASDGRLSPETLIAKAAASGITVLSITDHDTTAALAEARSHAAAAGVTLIDGIEITAVENARDVHILGYFFDPLGAPLADFLSRQRANRVGRVHEIAERLRSLGFPIETQGLFDAARGAASVGRPHVADALVAAGHVADRNEAFDRLIGHGRPAFVPRRGPSAVDVIRVIKDAGGIASFAHPGLTKRDELLPSLVDAGLAALEARHSDHNAATESHYRRLAAHYGLAISGGSDYHGDVDHHACELGLVTLPEEDFAGLQERLG